MIEMYFPFLGCNILYDIHIQKQKMLMMFNWKYEKKNGDLVLWILCSNYRGWNFIL